MPCEDVALVQITNPADRADFTQVEFADPASISQGEQVLALGYPGTAATARPEEFPNAQLSATNGIVSQVGTKYDVPGSDVAPLTDAIQHNAAVNHGNSGGPLFDLEGKQIGINTAIYFANGERLEGENYAISVRRIQELLPRLKTGDSQAWLGATFAQFGDDQGNPTAIVTDYLDAQRPLAQAGVPAGIAITSINGTDIHTYQDYCAVMKGVGNGSTIELHLVDPNTGQEPDLQVPSGRTGAHHPCNEREPGAAARREVRRLHDRGRARPRRHGRRVPRAPHQRPRGRVVALKVIRPRPGPRRAASASASARGRGAPRRSTTRPSCRSTRPASSDGVPFIAMRLRAGHDLQTLIRARGPSIRSGAVASSAAPRERARRRARRGPGPPRRQAGERPDRGRRRRRVYLTDFGLAQAADSGARLTAGRHLRRHRRLHGAGADRGRGRSTGAPTSTRSAACSTRR